MEKSKLFEAPYILIRVPLLTLFGAVLGLAFALIPRLVDPDRADGNFSLACQVIRDGPAFTGLRHFLFVSRGRQSISYQRLLGTKPR